MDMVASAPDPSDQDVEKIVKEGRPDPHAPRFGDSGLGCRTLIVAGCLVWTAVVANG